MWPYDPGLLNEQRALYQTIRRAREALSIVLRVVALVVGVKTGGSRVGGPELCV